MTYRHAMLCAVAMTLAACNVSSVANETLEASQDAPHQAKEAPMHDTIPAPFTPTPGETIRAIFDVVGDGSAAYEVENGSWAHFWYGYRFETAGKHYYTAFVYQTPEKYGDDPAEDYPDPGVPATITQATFVLASNDKAEQRWKLFGAQRHVGDFGAYEKGPTIDADGKIETYRAPDGHQLLSVPAWVVAPGGIRQRTAEVFVLSPSDLRWTHAGSLAAGEDNGAGCEADDTSRIPCAHSEGTLRFEPSSGEAIPDVAISLTGTAIDDKGHARPLDAGTLTRYRFNSRTSRYEPEH